MTVLNDRELASCLDVQEFDGGSLVAAQARGRIRESHAALQASLVAAREAVRQFLAELDDADEHGECGECPPTVATEGKLRALAGEEETDGA